MAIPRLTHRVWLGGPEPEWTAGFAETWQRPGWQLVTWDEEDIRSAFRPLRNQAIYDAADELAPDHVGQLRSDVVRLEILYMYGGLYVDTDFECLRPIDDLIEDLDCFAAWEVQDRWIANGLMGATPGHPFIGRLIDGLPSSVAHNRGLRPNRMTGPKYLTRMWREHGEGVEVLSQDLIYPYGWAEIGAHGPGEVWPDAVACHHWQNMRRERGVPA